MQRKRKERNKTTRKKSMRQIQVKIRKRTKMRPIRGKSIKPNQSSKAINKPICKKPSHWDSMRILWLLQVTKVQ